VADQGIVTAGVIYLPLRDLMYVAAAGQGAFLNEVAITPSHPASIGDSDVLAARPNMDAIHWRGGNVPGFHRSYRPSLAYRLALVAQGRFDGMLTLRPSWEWDIAAGDLILREAGAVCTDRHGAPLRFNNAHPQVNGVVAGGKMLHDQISKALDPDSQF
jgi:myo-inositol-1(or 4)-monophosphatase